MSKIYNFISSEKVVALTATIFGEIITKIWGIALYYILSLQNRFSKQLSLLNAKQPN